jgi:hypothetical protein
MKASRILISLRDLRFGCGADFGGNGRDDQGRHRQKRYGCFIYTVVHANCIAGYMPMVCEVLYNLKNGSVHPKNGFFVRFLRKMAVGGADLQNAFVQSWDSAQRKWDSRDITLSLRYSRTRGVRTN